MVLCLLTVVDVPFRPLGFDMEWRFYWSNGRSISRRTALVQIGDDKIILLVQLSAMTRELDMLCCDRSPIICDSPCPQVSRRNSR